MTIEQIVTQHYKRLARKAGRAEGRAIGLAEGREEGREETTENHIREMLLKGFSVEQIVDVLEISPEFVEQIREKIAREHR